MIYLDNAATSNPKPSEVAEAMVQAITSSANPGRAGHQLANSAARTLFQTRELIAQLFSVKRSENIVFTSGITESLNLALKGVLKSGDNIIVSSMEHNSMMRPLRALEQNGVTVTVIKADSETGRVDPTAIEKSITTSTKMIGINHISNVCGTVQPIKEIGAIAQKKGVLFLIDAAQSAGATPINMEEFNIDLLAFTGHKSLLGPMGVGGLVIGDRVDLSTFTPLVEGGTGSASENEIQPHFLPDFLESGTPNLPGIAGLGAAVQWILETGIENIEKRERFLTDKLIRGLQQIRGVTIVGKSEIQGSAISIMIADHDCGEVGLLLDRTYGIACRVGLHCSPTSHKTLGTFPDGTIRFSCGFFTTEEEINIVIKAVQDLIM